MNSRPRFSSATIGVLTIGQLQAARQRGVLSGLGVAGLLERGYGIPGDVVCFIPRPAELTHELGQLRLDALDRRTVRINAAGRGVSRDWLLASAGTEYHSGHRRQRK